VDRQRGRSMQEQAKQELNRRGLWGYVEPILTMGSAAFAEPVSGMMGLAALPYGSDAATRAINRTQEAMTYQPRTEDGQQGLQDAAEFMQPVGDAFIGASEYLGDAAYDATGSPALGAAAYSVPTMALEALGLKGVKAASKGRAAYEMGDIGSQASKYGGKQRGIFAGVKAKGADLDKMEAAKELANRGLSRDEIWQKTGWFEDVDGNWKWEIDDSGAKFVGKNRLNEIASKDPYGVADVSSKDALQHDALLDNYPNERQLVSYDKNSTDYYGGSFNPDTKEIVLGAGLDDAEMKSTLLHETQHAIQEREGFASGGNLGTAEMPYSVREPLYKDATKLSEISLEATKKNRSILDMANAALLGDSGKVSEIKKMLNPDEVKEALSIYREAKAVADTNKIKLGSINEMSEALVKQADSMDSFYRYERLAGEAEARNVQTRMNMTPEQRAATPPWSTLDVPEDELIVKRDGGVMQSVSFDDSTGYADVDSKISHIKEMTPDEYLQQAFEATDGRLGGSFDDWMRSNARSAADVDAYAKSMQGGDKFPLAYIDFDIGSQDGRNRALAAKKAGAKTIPVGIIEKPSAVERIKQIKDEMKLAKGYGLHRLKEELARLEQ